MNAAKRLAVACLLALIAAARGSALETPAPAADELHYMLDLGGWNDRIEALYEVDELQSGALALLQFASEDADWQVRLTATHFLGRAGDQGAPLLADIARSEPCPHIRLSALKWLQRLGPRGEALYRRTATEDDERLMADEPNEYHTEGMGKPVAIDTPNGMTKEFFNGGLDLRVCASSQRSGHRHVEIASRANGENEAAPELFSELPAPIASKPPVRRGVVTAYIAQEPPAALLPEYRRRDFQLDSLRTRLDPETLADSQGLPQRQATLNPGWTIAGSARRLERAAVPDHGARESLAAFPILPERQKFAAQARLLEDDGEIRLENDPVPALIDRLASADARRRALAADVLGTRGAAAGPAIPALRRVLKKDGDRRVRASAALALGKIGAADAVSDLRRALRDRSEDVRHSAKLALASLR
jgi:hypothetical protein